MRIMTSWWGEQEARAGAAREGKHQEATGGEAPNGTKEEDGRKRRVDLGDDYTP